MILTWKVFLIVCPMVFLAGFVDAIAGGGGLISLPAYLLAGLPAHMAIGTNKLSAATGTLVSTARYCRSGHVDWGLAIPCILGALAGAQVGARLALLVDSEVFKIVLLVTLPVIAGYVLFRKDIRTEGEIARKKQYVLISVISLVIGVYDGFYGPGTGTFLLLAYCGLAKMDVLKAGGNMKLANLASNISSLLVFLRGGVVLLPLGLAAAVFSIAGHYLGAGFAMKNGTKLVRIVILAVIGLLFVKVISEALGFAL